MAARDAAAEMASVVIAFTTGGVVVGMGHEGM